MKPVPIQFGVKCQKIEHDHEPCTYHFVADAIHNIVGAYGIVSDGDCKSKYVDILLPDGIGPSAHWPSQTARPGYRSNCGTDDLCFVVCAHPVERDAQQFGAVDQAAMINEAIAGGLLLYYPKADGSMASMPASPA